jgi:hypothetical protein
MNEKSSYNVEAVIDNGVYQDEVYKDVLDLMLKANIVTIRGISVAVKEIEVTDRGLVRFHGNRAEL